MFIMDGIKCEYDTRVISFRQFLPSGPLPDGSLREDDLIDVYTDPGGRRVIKARHVRKVGR